MNSNSGHVCHSPQHASSPVYVSNLGASSTGDTCSVTRLAGEVNVHVSTVPPAKQSHSKTQDHPGVRSDTNGPLVASQPWFPHLLRLCVDHPVHTSGTNCHNRYMSRMASCTVCVLRGSHAALPNSRIFKEV